MQTMCKDESVLHMVSLLLHCSSCLCTGKGNGKSSDPHPKERKKETAMKAESETNVPAKRPKLCSKDDKTVIDTIMEFQPISFFLTKVAGIDDKFNMTGAVSLKGRFFNDKKRRHRQSE